MFIEILTLFFGIVLFGMVILINNMPSKNIDREDIKTASTVAFFSGLFIMGGLIMCDEAQRPSSIDVYRNKTDLQIEYKIVNNDTINIDSTVVFKQNILSK